MPPTQPARVHPFGFDLKAMYKEITSLPDEPSLKRNTDGSYHKLRKKQNNVLAKISIAHIQSFNFMLEEGLPLAVPKISPMRMLLPNGDRLELAIIDVSLNNPRVPTDSTASDPLIYPAECRIRNSTYKGRLQLNFLVKVNDKIVESFEDNAGEIPIMLRSNKCNLNGLGPVDLVKRKEDSEEPGGYFIVNGKERLIRLLTAQRRNYPMGIERPSFKECGQLFSEFGVSIRCVGRDQQGANMVLHYLNNGTARLRIFYEKQPIFFPIVLILKALIDCSDQFIYQEMTRGMEDDSFYCSCCVNMLQLVQAEGLLTRSQIRKYIGAVFKDKLGSTHPWATEEEITDELMNKSVARHLEQPTEKFNLLIFMLKKVFAIAKGKAAIENPDSPMFHEVFTPGFIYFNLLVERMEMFLTTVKSLVQKKLTVRSSTSGSDAPPFNMKMLHMSMKSRYSDITNSLTKLVATGNMVSKTGIGLSQVSGLSVVADKINFWRFLSHFRSVHRGSFFNEIKTTTCRKLYPEAWGFLCPVHTPDGTPCGLLNHLAEMAVITASQVTSKNLIATSVTLGMLPLDAPTTMDLNKFLHVLLDGQVIGWIEKDEARNFCDQLRKLKVQETPGIPSSLEIGLVPFTGKASQYPGVYLFSSPCRMMRPVMNLEMQQLELIGTFEQPYMEISVTQDEISSRTTHMELRPTAMLSILAGQIPYPDFNQSPRNMYCCQMGKQTMGVPSHTLSFRSDQKMYQILSPAAPLVRPVMHDQYSMDDYPMGSSGVVAVISYTGYDMEDALILNKSSVERGFFHGSIIKTEIIDLKELDGGSRGRTSACTLEFGRDPSSPLDKSLNDFLDADGLPMPGVRVEQGNPLCCYIDRSKNEVKVKRYKSTEPAFIMNVAILGSDSGNDPLSRIAVKFCIPRIPTIGDKFANRHGQKGVVSFLWPQESMPFTESGMTPDIIFNPHGYPSRMTIGMMIESLAGKAGSLCGKAFDATPFKFNEENTPSESYGKLLESLGYNYYGTEKMYSGVDGRILKADIFIGVLYYIRLRHMVGDKYQVRSHGPIDPITRQPVKGRKNAGGIRFGEMERDSLLSHGAAFLLQDRLFNCSDKSTAYACTKCGSLLSTCLLNNEQSTSFETASEEYTCLQCQTPRNVIQVSVPYVLRYLVAELASVNIKCIFKFD